MPAIGNRVLQTTTTTGTGTYALGSAPSGYQAFLTASGVSSGATVCYLVVDSLDTPAAWEVGEGVVTAGSPATLTRTKIWESSAGGAVVAWPAGTKYVMCAVPAQRTPLLGDNGALSIALGGTGATTAPMMAVVTAATQAAARTALGVGDGDAPTHAGLSVSSAAGTARQVVYRSGAAGRFSTGVSGDAEAGTDSGSDYYINRVTDSGVVARVLTISRATGVAAYVGNVITTGAYGDGQGFLGLAGTTPIFGVTRAGNYARVSGFGGVVLESGATSGPGTGTAVITATTSAISLGGAPGAESLRITTVANAVNRLEITGSAVGGGVTVASAGSDANVPLLFSAKGTGANSYLGVDARGGRVVSFFSYVASPANYLRVGATAEGGPPELSAWGAGTDIDLLLSPKGAGLMRFGAWTAATGAVTGYVTIRDAAGNTRKLATIA